MDEEAAAEADVVAPFLRADEEADEYASVKDASLDDEGFSGVEWTGGTSDLDNRMSRIRERSD